MRFKLMRFKLLTPLLLLLPTSALAAPDSGNVAWVLVATCLVLLMTIPGLALFYAGMVRSKNVLSVLMQCFAICALVTLLWVLYGYSLAFSGSGALLGDGERLLLRGLGPESLSGDLPESVFLSFQMTFAIITPALITGAFAERMRFSSLLCFIVLWFSFVYVPLCHWVWGAGGWLGNLGVLDYAGGTVVHINAGIAGLAAAVMVGRRYGYPQTAMPPNNLAYTLVGASLLWVGWFGFNAGSGLAADGAAGMALLVTQIAASLAALTWMALEWFSNRKPTVLGIASGAVAGLVAITPAAGFVGVPGALVIGLAAGAGCYYAAVHLKQIFGFDDSLDVFAVHGVGGIIGALLTGLFAAPLLGGFGLSENVSGMGGQFLVQAGSVLVTVVYSGLLSVAFLWAIDRFSSLRVTREEEIEGLDIVLHDERGYNL